MSHVSIKWTVGQLATDSGGHPISVLEFTTNEVDGGMAESSLTVAGLMFASTMAYICPSSPLKVCSPASALMEPAVHGCHNPAWSLNQLRAPCVHIDS